MACDPGEEARVVQLAEELDSTIRLLKRRLGEIGDRRLAVMAGMTVLDKLKDAEARLAEMQERVAKLERAREAAALAAETEDEPLIARLDAATAAVERLTRTVVDEAHALSGEDGPAAAFSHTRARPVSDHVSDHVRDQGSVGDGHPGSARAAHRGAEERTRATPQPERKSGGPDDGDDAAGEADPDAPRDRDTDTGDAADAAFTRFRRP